MNKAVPASGSSHGVVRRNTLWNIFGLMFPLVLAFFFVPKVILGMGTERFGALTLIWAFLGYFSLFDLGLARALTQLLAGKKEEDEQDEADLVWMAVVLSTGLGLIAAVALFSMAPLLVSRLLHFEGPLRHEMLLSLRGLACVLPLLIQSLVLRGILEARRRFDLANLVKIPLGIFTYGAPLLVLPFSRNLFAIVAALLAGRILAWALNFWQVLRIMPQLRRRPRLQRRKLRQISRFGGWVTISNIVTPFTDNADRFLITSLLSISVVAYYTTPLEVMNKLWLISLGVGGVVFPEFAARFHRNRKEAESLYLRGTKYIVAALFPAVLISTAYAHEGLALWLNAEFAAASGPVVRWLALAALIGGFRLISYYFLVGVGRPHIPALYDLFELPIFAGVLYLLLRADGLRGVAIAATLRVTVGCVVYHAFSGRLLEFRTSSHLKTLAPLALATAIVLGFHAPIPPVLKAVLVLAALALHAGLVWVFVLEKKDKNFVLSRLGRPVS